MDTNDFSLNPATQMWFTVQPYRLGGDRKRKGSVYTVASVASVKLFFEMLNRLYSLWLLLLT